MQPTFPRMLQDYIEQQFSSFDEKRIETYRSIQSKQTAENWVTQCRKDLQSIYTLPSEKCPLNLQRLGALSCETYSIEKILFESRPGFYVTANTYIPKGSGPFPCVLIACGHSHNGKAEITYQAVAAGLASKGFIVLIYDPIGQGERLQYPDRDTVFRAGTSEHNLLGRQQYLIAEYFGSWRAWDATRALDCLLSHYDVKSECVGMTGNSGGGTMTTIMSALEDRLTMVSPGCFITTYRHNMLNELPCDVEQIPPNIIQMGHEEYDHLVAGAPRPTLICAKEDDFFDIRGTKEAYTHLLQIYTLLDKPEHIQLFVGKGGHGFDLELREAVYEFFCKHAHIDTDSAEPDLQLFSDEELQVTKTGQIAREGSKTVMDFTIQKADQLEKQRPPFSEETWRSCLQIPPIPNSIPAYRILQRSATNKTRIVVETEPTIFSVIKYSPHPSGEYCIPPLKKAHLFVPHINDESVFERHPAFSTESSNLQALQELYAVVSVRGMGESKYHTCNLNEPYLALYNADYFYSSYYIMFGHSLTGARVYDIIRVIQLLRDNGYTEFDLYGEGLGSLLALYAAPFIPEVKRLHLYYVLKSFRDILYEPVHTIPLSVLPPNGFLHMDIPDLIMHVKKDKHVRIESNLSASFSMHDEELEIK